MTDDWPGVKARLEVAAGTSSGHFDPKLPTYIRAALQRVEELETGYHRRKEELDEQYWEILRLRRQVEELEIAESAMNNLAAKLTAAEAKLAKVVEILDDMEDTDPDDGTAWFHDQCRAALSAAKGGE